MMSPKYSFAIIVLATLAMVPVTIHTYLGSTFNDGKSSQNINQELLSLYSLSTNEKPERLEKIFATKDWIKRSYIKDSGQKILLFVARSYDYKKLYHHPEMALVGNLNISDRTLQRLPEFDNLPVHMITSKEGQQPGIIAYSLLVDDTFVENPYVYQLSNSWKSLFRSTRPMTLFFVFDPSYSVDSLASKSIAVKLLNEAIRNFQLF